MMKPILRDLTVRQRVVAGFAAMVAAACAGAAGEASVALRDQAARVQAEVARFLESVRAA